MSTVTLVDWDGRFSATWISLIGGIKGPSSSPQNKRKLESNWHWRQQARAEEKGGSGAAAAPSPDTVTAARALRRRGRVRDDQARPSRTAAARRTLTHSVAAHEAPQAQARGAPVSIAGRRSEESRGNRRTIATVTNFAKRPGPQRPSDSGPRHKTQLIYPRPTDAGVDGGGGVWGGRGGMPRPG
jgi:hypothetical protein